MRQLDYRLLGPLEVAVDGEIVSLGRPQQRAVLAVLLLQPGKAVSTDQLIDQLWPEKPPGRPQTALQGYISALRKLLGAATITTSRGGYTLLAEPRQIDAHRFEDLLHQGQEALSAQRHERARVLLRTGLALWRGQALADFSYESWAQSEIQRLEELRLAALEEHIAARLALGDHRALVGELEGLVDAHPLRERPRGQLMLALYRSGRQANALTVYQHARERLLEDLGVNPSQELQALYKQILNQDEAIEVEPVSARPPTNLPVQPNAFIGRKTELGQVEELLGRDDVHLVTLTGVGGTGKTRLAHQVAANLLDQFRDGVFFVALSAIIDPDLVTPTIAQTLGVREQPGQPLLETLRDYLRERQTLLLLDNFEQVSDAATNLTVLLQTAKQLKLLATSRWPLHLSGEREYPVLPLALPDISDVPDLGTLAQSEAVTLFVERAQAVAPDFSLAQENAGAVVKVCARLDGLPLAIELAAARIRILPVQALLERLDERLKLLTGGARDAEKRQRTLRDTIQWSYELLSAPEQILFARLSVFVGGCRFEAAEAVCNPDAKLGADLLDAIASLVEKNLLRQREDVDKEPRFAMLETIRDYAAEQLAACIGEESRQNHADYYVELAQEGRRQLGGPNQLKWLLRLDFEADNFESAARYLISNGSETAIQLTSAMSGYWVQRGHLSSGRRLLTAALEVPATDKVRSIGLRSAGVLAAQQGDFDVSSSLLEEAVVLARRREDLDVVASSLRQLAGAALRRGDEKAARQLADESLEITRHVGDDLAYGSGLQIAAWAYEGEDPERAIAMYKESLQLFLRAGDEISAVSARNGLAALTFDRGDFATAESLWQANLVFLRDAGIRDELFSGTLFNLGFLYIVSEERQNLDRARALFAEALFASTETGQKHVIAYCLEGIASVSAILDEPWRAASLFAAASSLRAELNAPLTATEELMNKRFIEAARTALGEDDFVAATEWGRLLTRDEAVAYALEQPTISRPSATSK